MASNVELLTHSHNVIRAKKRQKLGQVKTVVFDEDARREFLTGFHKRKLAKKEESKKKAQARQKEERLEARQEHRRILAEQAAQNAARVEEAYGGFVQRVASDEEWTGIASSPSSGAGLDPEHEHEYEYSDEEQLATVTVVEDFDPSALLHGEPSSLEEQRPEEERPPLSRARAKVATRGRSADVGGARPTNEGKKNKNGAAKKVRYETKAARRATRATQRARRTEKAERAGGKAARKKTGGRRPRG